MIKMKKKLLVLVVVVALLSIVSITALAGPPNSASGTWYYKGSQPPVIREANGNQIWKIWDVGFWEGTFDGDSTDTGFVVLHSKGHWTYKGWVVLDPVTVDGITGSLEMRVNGKRPYPGADWTGTWVITGGTGDLKDLRGQGKWWGAGWSGDPNEYGEIPYSGNYHFKPDS